MSIYIKKDDETYPPHMEVAAGKVPCFLCHEPLFKTAIHWMGSTGDIYFHPSCAISFCRRLMQDCECYFDTNADRDRLAVTDWGSIRDTPK